MLHDLLAALRAKPKPGPGGRQPTWRNRIHHAHSGRRGWKQAPTVYSESHRLFAPLPGRTRHQRRDSKTLRCRILSGHRVDGRANCDPDPRRRRAPDRLCRSDPASVRGEVQVPPGLQEVPHSLQPSPGRPTGHHGHRCRRFFRLPECASSRTAVRCGADGLLAFAPPGTASSRTFPRGSFAAGRRQGRTNGRGDDRWAPRFQALDEGCHASRRQPAGPTRSRPDSMPLYSGLLLTRRAVCSRNRHVWRLVNMTITTGLVEAFLKCPTKCFLRSREEVGTGNAYADWVRTRSDFYVSEGVKRLAAGVAPDKCVTGTPTI